MIDESLPCPDCGSPMAIDPVALKASCGQCGAVRAISPVTGPERVRENLGMPPYAMTLLLSGVGIALLAFPALKWWQGKIAPETTRAPGAAPALSSFVWDVTQPPMFSDVNHDGIDDLVGRVRDDRGQSTMRVAVVDGATLKPVWSSDSLGDWADGLATVHIAEAGGEVLLTDAHGGVELHEASTGELIKRFALAGPAAQACAANDGTRKFWVEAGGQGAFVQETVPQPTPGGRPDWCPAQIADGPAAHTLKPEAAPALKGFEPALVLNEGTSAVAVGLTSGRPTLLGFDPSRPGVRWTAGIGGPDVESKAPIGADLVDGMISVPYLTAHGRRLASVDATSGKQNWDVEIPGQGLGTRPWERIIERARRIYVPTGTALAVFDARSGARLGLIGK